MTKDEVEISAHIDDRTIPLCIIYN